MYNMSTVNISLAFNPIFPACVGTDSWLKFQSNLDE